MAYANPIHRGITVPSQAYRGVLIGCFHPRALVEEVEIWRRLMQAEQPEITPRILLIGLWEVERDSILQALPPSVAKSVQFQAEDTDWRRIVQPDRPERAFAAVVDNGQAEMLVVGAPTEEAWEEFSSRL